MNFICAAHPLILESNTQEKSGRFLLAVEQEQGPFDLLIYNVGDKWGKLASVQINWRNRTLFRRGGETTGRFNIGCGKDKDEGKKQWL